MQVTIDEIVDVIAVGNRFMATTWSMDMVGSVTSTTMTTCASSRIVRIDIERMLLDAACIGRVMQMTVMQIVDVVLVLDRGMPALCAVLVIVVCVLMAHRMVYSSVDSVVGSLPCASPFSIKS